MLAGLGSVAANQIRQISGLLRALMQSENFFCLKKWLVERSAMWQLVVICKQRNANCLSFYYKIEYEK